MSNEDTILATCPIEQISAGTIMAEYVEYRAIKGNRYFRLKPTTAQDVYITIEGVGKLVSFMEEASKKYGSPKY